MSDAFCICGIDPGQKGAVAFYFPDYPAQISAEDMPIADKGVCAVTLFQRLEQFKPNIVVLENVWAQPGNGRAQAFRYGEGFGIVQGVVASMKIPLHLVTPNKWKKHFSLSADKEKSRAMALRFWPSSEAFSRKRDDGRAEAALLARYGAEVVVRREIAA